MAIGDGDVTVAAKRPNKYSSDRISKFPDELLHRILLRLPSVAAAARTSVLSRRWRRVWAHLPELSFLDEQPTPPSTADSVDGALAGYSAPTLNRLAVSLCNRSVPISAARVAAWLRFASQRLGGELGLWLPLSSMCLYRGEQEELELPLCERVTKIELALSYSFRLRLPRTGTFAALLVLRIFCCRLEARELEGIVSSQCPRLRELDLKVTNGISDLSIRSDSLEQLDLCIGVGRIDVAAPRLHRLVANTVERSSVAYFATPKLAELTWCGAFDPSRHWFVDVGSHLRKLYIILLITSCSTLPAMLQRFDAAVELTLNLYVPQGPNFLRDMSKLPKCESLTLSLETGQHNFVSCVLHFLRRCVGLKKVTINMNEESKHGSQCSLEHCPCGKPENQRTVALDSLEEVEVVCFRGTDHDLEFVKLLFRCKPILKRMTIDMAPPFLSKEMCDEIRGFSPSTSFEFCHHLPDWSPWWVPLA